MYVPKTNVVTGKLIYIFVFAYAKGLFSHDVAHLILMSVFKPHHDQVCLQG